MIEKAFDIDCTLKLIVRVYRRLDAKMKRERDSWWDWRAKRIADEESSDDVSGMQERSLERLVERCVVLDNLSPASSVHTIRTALEQFGKVSAVKLLRDCQTCSFTGIAIAEMENKEQRDQVVKEVKDYLLMIGQMPRPAHAIPATPELMVDHPLRRFSRKLVRRLVSQRDPRWKEFHEIAIQENLHLALQNELIQHRKEEEAKLERAQERQCQESIDKLKMIEHEQKSKAFQEVKKFYGVGR